jgi:hypothetical protein
MKTRHILLGIVLAVGLAEVLVQSWTPGPSVSAPPPSEPTLAQVRRATERFRNVKVALAEGYIRDPSDVCETAEMMGRPMSDDPNTALDEAHMFEPHFDRHVWIYRENPNGVFTPLNPAVTCANHRGPDTHTTPHNSR